MAEHEEVDLSESSIYGRDTEGEVETFTPEDIATTATIDRLEAITGGVDADDDLPATGKLARETDALEASTDEEIDALELNLTQVDERRVSRDGTGPIVDDVAEERLAEFTETGPRLADEGVDQVVPGREDTSETLRRHHPNTDVARADAVVEGNLDEPRDEEVGERMVDEGTAG